MGQNNDVVFLGDDEQVVAACELFAAIKPEFVPEFRVLDVSKTLGPRVFCGAIAAVSFSFVPLEQLLKVGAEFPELTILIMQDHDERFVDIGTLEKEPER